jgi:hypothetical protein
MSTLNNALSNRLQKKEGNVSKMSHLAERSQEGALSSFSGIFQVGELSSDEKKRIEEILHSFSEKQSRIADDLEQLLFLTSEVKAITHQAVLLHGERIQKAQQILRHYKEGAFTSWLIATYGNRQTPYNFLRYFEFWQLLNSKQKAQAELMPRQAIYSLASREGELEKKMELIESFSGQTKTELLRLIRDLFPLSDKDRRKTSFALTFTQHLERLLDQANRRPCRFTKKQKEHVVELLSQLEEWVQSS